MSVERTRLEDRRRHLSQTVEWQGQEWLLTAGFDREGRVRETFLEGVKVGSMLDATLEDACVLVSLLLQVGFGVADLDRHLGREGADIAAPAASPIGFVAREAARLETECGKTMRAVYADFFPDELTGRASDGAPGPCSESD